jgi:hypothetical protein
MTTRAERLILARKHAEEHTAAVMREVRLEVLAMHKAGEPKTKIRDDLGVSLPTIDKWIAQASS